MEHYRPDESAWPVFGSDQETGISAVNLEDTCQQLKNLVEDKDIAARAVAFVVNSTRKGIVPLCSDVANLLRIKQKLEMKVKKLRMENENLRTSCEASAHSSQSASPMPASLRSYGFPTYAGPDVPEHTDAEAACPEASTDSGLGPHKLPEIVDQPGQALPKVTPLDPRHKESQTDPLLTLPDGASGIELQFRETLKLNARLAEELGAAKKEVELLKARVKEVEMQQLARQYLDADDDALYKPVTSPKHDDQGTKGFIKLHMTSSMFFPSPMDGCLCACCNADPQPDTKLRYASTFDQKGHQVPIQISDYVVAKGDLMGHVRYIGHMEKMGHTNMVFVGLDLDAPVGQNDGSFEGKQYFQCRPAHGVFVPVQDVVCIVYKKPVSRSLLRKSSDSDSSGYCRPAYQRRRRLRDRRNNNNNNGNHGSVENKR